MLNVRGVRTSAAGGPPEGAGVSGTADITITEIDLDNTLLLDAVNKGKARFVSDCASYLQVCRVGRWAWYWADLCLWLLAMMLPVVVWQLPGGCTGGRRLQ